MSKVAIAYGGLLIALGLVGFLGFGRSVTALIPAFLGAPIAICGGIALKHAWRKHAMHVAVLLALLGLIGVCVRFVPSVLAGKSGAPVVLQGLFVLLTLAFIALAVRSFVVARLPRKETVSPE